MALKYKPPTTTVSPSARTGLARPTALAAQAPRPPNAPTSNARRDFVWAAVVETDMSMSGPSVLAHR